MPTDESWTLLPENHDASTLVDDTEFTEITEDGEIYTRYVVVRFTHEIKDSPDGWTHVANVSRVRRPAIGTALLSVKDRQILESKVTINQVPD